MAAVVFRNSCKLFYTHRHGKQMALLCCGDTLSSTKCTHLRQTTHARLFAHTHTQAHTHTPTNAHTPLKHTAYTLVHASHCCMAWLSHISNIAFRDADQDGILKRKEKRV
jgi:hypothetical protein